MPQAVGSKNPQLVVSGTADGRVVFWNSEGKYLAEARSLGSGQEGDEGDLAHDADYFIRSGNYYMASPQAARKIRFNEGIEGSPFFDQFDLVYNRPDKVMKAIGIASSGGGGTGRTGLCEANEAVGA
jgi:hypothetical protein